MVIDLELEVGNLMVCSHIGNLSRESVQFVRVTVCRRKKFADIGMIL